MEELKETTYSSKVINIESDFSDIDPETIIDITNKDTDTTLFQKDLSEECYSLAQQIYKKLI